MQSWLTERIVRGTRETAHHPRKRVGDVVAILSIAFHAIADIQIALALFTLVIIYENTVVISLRKCALAGFALSCTALECVARAYSADAAALLDIGPKDRKSICTYGARGAIASSRLSMLPSGTFGYELKRP